MCRKKNKSMLVRFTYKRKRRKIPDYSVTIHSVTCMKTNEQVSQFKKMLWVLECNGWRQIQCISEKLIESACIRHCLTVPHASMTTHNFRCI